MSSTQQPKQKRPRCDSNNNVNAQNNNCNTSNTNINLLSLPEEALNNIISYSLPRKECQVWEWIGILSQTCTSFRQLAQTYAPTRIVLKDFRCYTRLYNSDRSVDVRVGFLQSLQDFSWKRQHLKDFHVNIEAVLRWRVKARGIKKCCNDIKALIRTLLTTQASFPELEWLDIELQSNENQVYSYDLIDAESLQLIPDALPSLQKLSLSKCFKYGIREISPYRLKQFFNNLQTPLTSLSLCGPEWMTDAHLEAMMPIVGENLVRLVLVDCVKWDENGVEMEEKLSDNSLISIVQHCKQLKSFSMVSSDITCRGLEMVLRANTDITTLDLSSNKRLEIRAVEIISRYLPRLKELRSYWPRSGTDWLNDDGLIALVDAQEKEPGGSEIFLNLIGLYSYDDLDYDGPQLTIRGIKYAIEKGVKEIEIDEGELHNSIKDLGSDVKLYQPHEVFYIDGSTYERKPVQES